MAAGGTDVSAALAKITAAITHRNDLFERWQNDIAADQVHGLPAGRPTAIQNALLHAASLGLLDAKTAEGLAAELGCKRLANRPDISTFDPRSDSFWSLPMAIAWAMSREWKKVARQKANYRAAKEYWFCTRNVGLPKDGLLNGYVIDASWQIRNLGAATIDGLLLEDSFEAVQSLQPASGMTALEAKRALWRALQEQRLTAYGRQGGTRKPIPAFLWQDLLPFRDGSEAPEHLREGSHGQRWDDVTVSRDNVLREWPPGPDEAPQEKPQVEAWHRFAATVDDALGTDAERAVRRAVRHLWPDGIPVGMPKKIRNERINDWARKHSLGRSFSDSTILRALRF